MSLLSLSIPYPKIIITNILNYFCDVRYIKCILERMLFLKPINTSLLRSSIPFFQEIDQQLLEQLSPYMREQAFSKGSIIFHEGEEGNQIFFIRTGMVCIYTSNKSKRITLAYLDKGEYFGEMALMQPGLLRSATAEAMTAVKVYSLHRTDFQKLVERDRNLPFLLLNYTMERLRKSNQQIYDLTFLNVQLRIVRKILELGKEFGELKKDGSIRISVKITHQQLADAVGAARETVSKIINELQEKSFIDIKNKYLIILQAEQLEALMDEWYAPQKSSVDSL